MTTTKLTPTLEHLHSSTSRYQLPFEVEREICEIAADNFPECIPSLILIARRFRIWFEPELYQMIVSVGAWFFPPLYLRQPQDSESDSLSRVVDKVRIKSFGRHVQHVLLWRRSPKEIAEILECCPNVFDLALWVLNSDTCDRLDTCDLLMPILENLPLRKLSIDPSYLFPDSSLKEGTFCNITHIHLLNPESVWQCSTLKQLARLPKLTHLALQTLNVDQTSVQDALEECRTLVLIVLFYYPEFYLEAEWESVQRDDRVVLVEPIMDSLDEWRRGTRGGKDFWAKAQIVKEEAIQTRKRNAEIRATIGQS